MLKQFSEEEVLRRPLSPEQKAEVLALMNVRDEDIDTSDIPETKELPPGTVPRLFYRGSMVRLNRDLQRYFADLARRKQVPMNDLVNEALEKAVAVAEVVKIPS
jgi:hypothetical protein